MRYSVGIESSVQMEILRIAFELWDEIMYKIHSSDSVLQQPLFCHC